MKVWCTCSCIFKSRHSQSITFTFRVHREERIHRRTFPAFKILQIHSQRVLSVMCQLIHVLHTWQTHTCVEHEGVSNWTCVCVLTQPVLALDDAESSLVVFPRLIEIHTAVHSPLNHLKSNTHTHVTCDDVVSCVCVCVYRPASFLLIFTAGDHVTLSPDGTISCWIDAVDAADLLSCFINLWTVQRMKFLTLTAKHNQPQCGENHQHLHKHTHVIQTLTNKTRNTREDIRWTYSHCVNPQTNSRISQSDSYRLVLVSPHKLYYTSLTLPLCFTIQNTHSHNTTQIYVL